MLSVKLGRRVPIPRQVGCRTVNFPVRREQAMLRYAIVLQVALVATAASSAPDTQPTYRAYAKSPMAGCRSLTTGTLVSPSATLLPTFRAGDDARLRHLFSCSAGFARKGFAESDNCECRCVALLRLNFTRIPHENADVIDQRQR